MNETKNVTLFAFQSGRSQRTEVPFAALLPAIRQAVADGATRVSVDLPAGDYYPDEPLCLSGNDLGKVALDVVCRNGKARLCGWVPVTGFCETVVNDTRAWVAEMPKRRGETLYAHQFFDRDGNRLERPRFPEEGFLRPVGLPGYEEDDAPFNKCNIWAPGINYCQDRLYSFYFAPGELPPITKPGDVQVCMNHYWVNEKMTLKDVDCEKNLLTVASAPAYMFDSEFFADGKRQGGRYFLDNVFETFKKPGQVYEDRETDKLFYIPREGELIDECVIYASDLEQLLIVDGMDHLSFENIAFVGSDWKRTDRHVTVGEQQAAADVKIPAVSIDNSSHLRFDGCDFLHVGNYAVKILQNTHHVTLSHCAISDVGAGGFWCAGVRNGNETDGPAPDVPHDITVSDCRISHYGRIFPDAVGLFFQHAYDVNLIHNEICHAPYSGISLGWSWSYAWQPAGYRVEKNHIYDIGMEMLSDAGGIYTNGVLQNSRITGNVIHDVCMAPGGYGGWGIYTDAFSGGLVIENNVVYDCTSQPFNSSQADGNIVRNNVFAFGDLGSFQSVSSSGHMALTLERNILVSDFRPLYRIFPDDPSSTYFVDDRNLLWDYTLKTAVSGGMEHFDKSADEMEKEAPGIIKSLKEKGFYRDCVIADPLFRDPQKRDFTLSPDSPALAIGFMPIDTSHVGPRT